MKKTLLLLLITALGVVSCDDFLNTEPINKISIKQYYTDEAGLTQALAGVYDQLGSDALYGNGMFLRYNGCTDEGYYARSTVSTGVFVNNFDPTNSDINSLWQSCYLGINRANDLIANVDLPVMDENKRKIILGEAIFLRGYYYFLLVSHFENIPLILTPTTSPNDVYVAQTPMKDVYRQILKDMTDAEEKVSTSTEFGYSSRVSKTVVQGILARVCLQMSGYPMNDATKFADALSWAKKVQTSGEHGLRTTYNSSLTNSAYSQIFINHAQDVYDIKESMWEIDFLGNRSDGNLETGRVGNTNGITMTSAALTQTLGYSYGFIKGTARLYKGYKTGDLRRDWVLTPFTYNNATGAKVPITITTGYGRDCAKWRREFELSSPKNKNHGPINFPVLRYADVLLMIAEAENQVNGPTTIAYDALNQVRRRGFGLNIATASVVADAAAGLSKADFQLAVENERMLELCFEGTRHLDLIRWNKYVSTMNSVGNEIATNGGAQAYGGLGGKNVTARHLVYPIPAKERSVNKKLDQNKDW
ncbi:RagB/SusD family nutrient uptake outer membrane protein [Flavobacterium ovatum]|uniref:RagB/SusD family nutrient uptake outer membrane protein n=1 Tax=Flavobacterium ovatum TaxID=1928857 RepID=UPI00344C567B